MERDTANTELIRGHVDTIILRTLQSKDSYPYDILKEIEEKSSGKYVLKQATLYSCMKRLERAGYINSYWGTESEGGRRRYYSLTDIGRDFLTKDQQEWEYSRTLINQLLSDREVDLDSIAPPFDASALRPLTRRGQSPETASNSDFATDTEDASLNNLSNDISTEITTSVLTENRETLAESVELPRLEQTYITRKPIFRHNEQTVEANSENDNIALDTTRKPLEEVARFIPQSQTLDESNELYEPELNENMVAAANLLQIGEFRQQRVLPNQTEVVLERPTVRNSQKNGMENYRDVLGKIFDKPLIDTKPTQNQIAVEETDLNLVQKGRHIKELQNQLTKQGYHLKIYSPKNRSDFYYNKYVYQNKINFAARLIMFILLAIQFAFIIGFNHQIGFQAPILIVSVIVAAIIPALYAVNYFVNRSRRIRANYNFTQSVIIRLVLSLVLIGIHTIICLISPSLGITFQNVRMYIPWIMSLNIPLYAVVYQMLYASKKFHLTAKKA